MSNYKEGQVSQLANRLEGEGYTADDLTSLGQFSRHKELLGVLRGTHEITAKDLLSRKVTGIDLSQSPHHALEATGRKLHVNDDVVKTMPNGDNDEVFFFNLGHYVSDNDLEGEYASRELAPCDPYTLAKVNQDDPAFGDDYPNSTHWKDGDDKWCFAAFGRWDGERVVYVDRCDDDWGGDGWFAGVRK